MVSILVLKNYQRDLGAQALRRELGPAARRRDLRTHSRKIKLLLPRGVDDDNSILESFNRDLLPLV